MSRKVAHPFPAPQGVKLQIIQPWALVAWFRELDDLSPARARAVSDRCGVSAESVLASGCCKVLSAVRPASEVARRYGLPESLCSAPRGSVFCSVRDSRGAIVALHRDDLSWFTAPAIHFSNPRRFRDGVYLAANTLEAEAWALGRNAAAIGLNECQPDAIAAALATFGNSVQVITERRLAA